MLKKKVERNFHFDEGLLTIIDGSKGLHNVIEGRFGDIALIQRCQWHNRENIISYLQEEKDIYRGILQRAYDEPEYETAKRKLLETRKS